MRQFVMTDLHGCNGTFNALLDKIAFSTTDELYLLGDYIDRGPDSKGVIDTILGLKAGGYNVHCLTGNHEQMLLQAIRQRKNEKYWLMNGGDTTLDSFGCLNARDIPEMYLSFLRDLDFYFEIGQFICVHAGLGFGMGNPNPLNFMDEYTRHQLVWRRNWYDTIDYSWLGNRYIIHGHTPSPISELYENLENMHINRFLNLDTGCVYPRTGFGVLSCFETNSCQLTTMNYVG